MVKLVLNSVWPTCVYVAFNSVTRMQAFYRIQQFVLNLKMNASSLCCVTVGSLTTSCYLLAGPWVSITTRPSRPAGLSPPRVKVLGPESLQVWVSCLYDFYSQVHRKSEIWLKHTGRFKLVMLLLMVKYVRTVYWMVKGFTSQIEFLESKKFL